MPLLETETILSFLNFLQAETLARDENKDISGKPSQEGWTSLQVSQIPYNWWQVWQDEEVKPKAAATK